MDFNDLGLHPDILKAVEDAGYTVPSAIQLQAIPVIKTGVDLRASAQTGTGKTAAFLLPALDRLTAPSPIENSKGPRILILVPTRELAMQIEQQANKYSKYLNQISTVCVVGGVPYPKQVKKLSRYHDILIATPGRLIDLIDKGKIDFARLEQVILDEADRMLDMGFVEPVEDIIEMTPASRQTLLFSATLKGSVIKLSNKLLDNPEEIIIEPEVQKNKNIEEVLHYTDNLDHKNRLLDHILTKDSVGSAIVFTGTKRHADQLVDELINEGFDADALHGDMSQRQRTRTINMFKKGKVNILIATDVAARGIDVDNISHVINFDMPQGVEDYVHRIGRTGRAGASGKAISFASQQERGFVKQIEKYTERDIAESVIEGLEPVSKPRSGGDRPGGGSRNRRRGNSSGGNSSRGNGSKRGSRFSGGRDRESSSRSRDGERRGSRDGGQDRGNRSSRDGGQDRGNRSSRDDGQDRGNRSSRDGEGRGNRDDSRSFSKPRRSSDSRKSSSEGGWGSSNKRDSRGSSSRPGNRSSFQDRRKSQSRRRDS